jgi:hypothetical protein
MHAYGSFVLIACTLLLPLGGLGQAPTSQEFLASPVNPLVTADVPLTTALSRIGNAVRDGGHVVFGTEVLLSQAGEEPHVTLNLIQGETVETAIDSVFRQLPDYRWVVVADHLVNVLPTQRLENDLLEIQVPVFDVKDQYPGNILANPTLFISELLRAVVSENSRPLGGFGYGASYALSEGPHLSLSFRDLTIREILNQVTAQMIKNFPADSTPVGWVCAVRPDPTMPAGRVYSWNTHRSVSLVNWRSAVAVREKNGLQK